MGRGYRPFYLKGQNLCTSQPYDLTLIVPVYNAETFISPCLDSLLLINVKKEIIVIDDGSTDNTPNILANYIRQYPDIKYHYQPNQGVSAARNRGIGLAQGRFIQFVDADDYLIYTHYAAILSVLDHFQLDLIQWLHIEEDHSQNPPYKYAVPLHFPANKPAAGLIVNSEEVISQLITEQHRITCWSGLYRKSYLDRYRIRFEEGISACEDNILWLTRYCFKAACSSTFHNLFTAIVAIMKAAPNALTMPGLFSRYLPLVRSSNNVKACCYPMRTNAVFSKICRIRCTSIPIPIFIGILMIRSKSK